MRGLCSWCRPSLFVPLIGLLALAGMAGGCSSVQSDVHERSTAELERAGLAAVTVDGVEYRSVTLSGPAELETEAVGLVEALEATRDVTYLATGDADVTTSTTVATATAATASVTVTVADDTVVLAGEVPDEASQSALVAAAGDAFGDANVTDELTVAGTTATMELSGSVADLASIISSFPGRFVSGTATLEGTTLTVEGQGADAVAVTELETAVAALGGVDATSTLEPAATGATLDLSASISAGSVTLTGAVPDDTAKGAVVEAATVGFGAGNVTDELTVAGTGASADETSALAALGTVLQGPATGLSEGTVTLVGTTLTIDGTAATPAEVSALNDATAGLTGVEVSGTVGADPTQTVDALGELLTLAPINFESGSDVITADSEEILLTAVEYLTAAFAAEPGLAVEIGGHTDDQGDERFNLDLSEQRASAVLQFLTDNGVPAAGLTATGYGETRPVADNATSEGRAQNRRIEFTIVEG